MGISTNPENIVLVRGLDWCHLEQMGSPLYDVRWNLALEGNI